MNELSSGNTSGSQHGDDPARDVLVRELAEARAEIARLNAEYDDIRMLYEGTIEHGEAVEDQLAEANLALMKTQERLEAELNDAARYVMSILPEPRVETPATDWLLVPSTELGGDSFGYHAIDDDHMAFYLLDVCGHGVNAALLSVTVINVLRASALPGADFRDPAGVLSALNNAFPMERQNGMFFTIWYGVYRRSSGELRFATGGHPPAIHLRDDGAGGTAATQLITFGGMAIGAFPDVDYECGSMLMQPGDRLLILSDGTFEVDGVDGDMLSVDALAEFARTRSSVPQDLLEWIRQYNIGSSLPDDFSLLRVLF
ncbi:PP2C family protein-serine/threonine phosphatase [Mesorhizobium sp. CAU 1741]|uniref:PP2C family protein-serine/threonine phosphatase n=1 Tax=Mesorhizobium sp. CAU 1741 TaxID=3140366 RepID=UPI00325AAE87